MNKIIITKQISKLEDISNRLNEMIQNGIDDSKLLIIESTLNNIIPMIPNSREERYRLYMVKNIKKFQ